MPDVPTSTPLDPSWMRRVFKQLSDQVGALRALNPVLIQDSGEVVMGTANRMLTALTVVAQTVRVPLSTTTSATANVNVSTIDGTLARVTSSRRYKQDITDAAVDPTTLLQVRLRTWRDRNEVLADPDTTVRYVGVIAEEVDELGLTEFVEYDDQGRPDAIRYDRLALALLVALQNHDEELDDLREAVTNLQSTGSTDKPVDDE